jgi:DNA-binding HxlR family transcriptional regulator
MDDPVEPLEACPALTEAFGLLGKRWTALILDVLSGRPARFCEIPRAIPGLSDRLLAERLRELAAAGLVQRRPDRGNAYELTDVGRRLLPGLNEIRRWAQGVDRLAPAQDTSAGARSSAIGSSSIAS